jgi:glycerol-3-phosphate acyltransferase PlsY
VLAALVFWTHRENIKRLQEGNERRLGEKAKVSDDAVTS